MQPEGNVFAPGNLRASCDNPKYKALVDYWLEKGFTLRCKHVPHPLHMCGRLCVKVCGCIADTGGMVPDTYHILFKGKGIFTNVRAGRRIMGYIFTNES